MTRGRLVTALVHYPCVNKHGAVFTTSITNLDVHDIARSSRSYGVAAFYVVTPISAQQAMAKAIAAYWEGDGVKRNADRQNAMRLVRVVSSVKDVLDAEQALTGTAPLVIATSAKPQGAVPYDSLRMRLATTASSVLLFGTGHGMAPSIMDAADVVLAPLLGGADDGYNHLSVRSAAAIILDRLLG